VTPYDLRGPPTELDCGIAIVVSLYRERAEMAWTLPLQSGNFDKSSRISTVGSLDWFTVGEDNGVNRVVEWQSTTSLLLLPWTALITLR
jgi:hypothetical protein